MGSEGRGEQILKTDQDNALLLRDGFELRRPRRDVAARFNAALIEFGYPPCPGDIMLTNPLWRQPRQRFRETLRDWIYGPRSAGPMHLAIFFDAARWPATRPCWRSRAITWTTSSPAATPSLPASRRRSTSSATQSLVVVARPRRDDTPLDLKKLGTFPIVHGVRALRCSTACASRRHRGAAAPRSPTRGLLDAALARDLVDALHCLMGLKLATSCASAPPAAPTTWCSPPTSHPGARQLRDALAIVKRFRALLRQSSGSTAL